MKIFEAIRKDHDIQRSLCDELIKTSGDTKHRKSIWEKLKKELKVHAQAEERFFYVPLIEEDMTQKHARHGVAEHHEMDELIEKIDKAEMDNSAWLTYAKQLREKVYHHLEDEEHTFFQLAGKVLTEKEKDNLEKAYRSYMTDGDAGIEASEGMQVS